MDVFPKFIIEGDALIIQKATYHKDIATDRKQVRGGGWFRYSDKTNTFTFFDQSEDFGPARYEDIKKCVEEGKVFEGRGRRRNISDRYKFAYDMKTSVIPIPRPVKLFALREGDEFEFVDHFSDIGNKVLENKKPESRLMKVEKPSGMMDYYDSDTLVILKTEEQ